MRMFAVLAITCLSLFFLFHSIFIMFDYAYYNPDSGALLTLSETMNETLTPAYQNLCWNQSVMFRQAFGVGRFIVLGFCVLFFIVDVADWTISYRKQKGT